MIGTATITGHLFAKDWSGHLCSLVEEAKSTLVLCSPYISSYGCETVAKSFEQQERRAPSVYVVTDLSPGSICQGSTDPSAILDLVNRIPCVEVRHLPRLHAKVYIADTTRAIVTSANLTAGGLVKNYEYGIQVVEPILVDQIRKDILDYSSLGSSVSKYNLAIYSELSVEIRASLRDSQKSASSALCKRFETAVYRAEDELIRIRLSGGAMHTVFTKTIQYLLHKHGPMNTPQLHAQIEQIHPDLCNNNVDRIIDGKRFGKKWKHAVRTAQQHLKRQGVVELRGDAWNVKEETFNHTTAV